MSSYSRFRFALVAAVLSGVQAGCTGCGVDPSLADRNGAASGFEGGAGQALAGATKTAPLAVAAAADPVLEAYTQSWVEIDHDGVTSGDANLFTGADPADATPSFQKPAGAGPFADWEAFAGDIDNHRLLDLNDPATGRDPSAFPGSDECVAAANVLEKMNLNYIGVAANDAYTYLAVQRAANTGDAGWYWLFTKKPPRQLAGAAPCRPSERRLVFDFTGANGSTGDVLIAGHFKPSAEPLIKVFHATRDAEGVSAVEAVNFQSDLWKLDTSGDELSAVNTTPTAPGSWGAQGVKSMAGANLGTELFAEAAVPIRVFTGSDSACGATFYGSVITRSSGAGGTSPDLKDLAGPALFRFGGVTATARLTPRCDQAVGYELLSALGSDGQPVPSPTCAWTFDDGSTASDCSGTHALPVGRHVASVTVGDPRNTCTQAVTTDGVDVFAPLAATANATPTCLSAFDFSAGTTGGSTAGVSYRWSFAGPAGSSARTDTPTAASGRATVSPANVDYVATVVVTDLRADLTTCTATGVAPPVHPLAPLAVNLVPDGTGATCPALASDAVTYAAVASGGNGTYGYAWTGAACSGTTCTLDPADGAFCVGPTSLSVQVTDSSGLCGAFTSETEEYAKVTTVTATNR